MGLTDWLRQTWGNRHFPDTFALHREQLWEGIADVLRQAAQREHWLVVAHFPETFQRLCAALDRRQIDFRIATQTFASSSVREQVPCGEIQVTLAGMLQASAAIRERPGAQQPVAVLMVERHPLRKYDQGVESFVAQIQGRRRLAFYQALDDPLIQGLMSPQIIEILRQFGLAEQHLISSHLVSRGVARLQRKIAARVTAEQRADSCAVWLQANGIV